jgi:hypothetical protein
MKYSVVTAPKVNRLKKKLPRPPQALINAEVAKIAENPFHGQRKKGDLAKVWVHKFKYHDALILTGYLSIRSREQLLYWRLICMKTSIAI